MKYTITQASDILNCKPYLLRFYEDEFKLEIPRETNNRRYYTNKEIDIFKYIEELKNKGKKNKEIKDELEKDNTNEKEDNTITVETTNANNTNDINESIVKNLLEIVSSLKEEIEFLKQQDSFKEKDELLAQNARLKMKLKEKTYELSILKEKYNTLKSSKKRSLFHYE